MADRIITTLVAHQPDVPRDWVLAHLPADQGLRVTEVVDDLAETWTRLETARGDVLLLACEPESEQALPIISWWTAHRPDAPVVVLSYASTNGFVGRVFEAGADDIVVAPDAEHVSATGPRDVAFSLQKAVARRAAPVDAPTSTGSLICVLGPKGGIGKTLTSCNLGVTLAEQGESVVLVDLDLQFGDLALSLGLSPERTIYDLVASGGTLDAGKVDSFLAMHPSGARVLLAPVRPDQAASVTPAFLSELYGVLRERYGFVIVDTPPGFTPEVITTIDASTGVCMVGMLDALSLKNTKLGLETLDLMDYSRDRINVVLNRADTAVGITHNDVVSIIGRSPDVLVPSHRDITRSVNEGVPIVLSQKKSEAAKAFRTLAELYTVSRPEARAKRSGRSLLGRSRG
jgi:pilus assembly protein CpaE